MAPCSSMSWTIFTLLLVTALFRQEWPEENTLLGSAPFASKACTVATFFLKPMARMKA
ncbi:hypothetical protein D9M69_719330 [compost metagenome]